ncbi:hypothetical protein FRB98_002451, partial [Tulasnella sp. 332]
MSQTASTSTKCALELGPDLRLINLEGSLVLGIQFSTPDGDDFSVTDVAEVAEPKVAPLVTDFIIEGLELGDSLLLLEQLLASF